MNRLDKKQILDAYLFRHACKEFDKNKIIPKEDFDFILEIGRLSPSSFGFEPWHFIVVQDPSLREQLKAAAWGAPDKLDTASHFVIGLTQKSYFTKYDSQYIADFMKEVQKLPEEVIKAKSGFIEAFQKTDFDLNDERSLFDWAGKQCYIPLANMMSVAAMIGIDSCPMEGFKQNATETVLGEKFGVDLDKYGLSYLVAFGYRKNEPKGKTRRAMKEIVTWFEND